MSRRASSRKPSIRLPIVAMVTDRRRYAGDAPDNEIGACQGLADAVARAADAGVDVVQLRERGLDDGVLLALATRLRTDLHLTQTRLFVNDRIDVAVAADASGVHLPADAVEASKYRKIAPEGFLVGRSVHSVAEADAAERDGGCDYLVFGTVFESHSKPDGHPVAGIGALADVCAAVQLPVLAIGGITRERVLAVVRAGAAGVAAIGLFATGDRRELGETVDLIRAAFAAA